MRAFGDVGRFSADFNALRHFAALFKTCEKSCVLGSSKKVPKMLPKAIKHTFSKMFTHQHFFSEVGVGAPTSPAFSKMESDGTDLEIHQPQLLVWWRARTGKRLANITLAYVTESSVFGLANKTPAYGLYVCVRVCVRVRERMYIFLLMSCLRFFAAHCFCHYCASQLPCIMPYVDIISSFYVIIVHCNINACHGRWFLRPFLSATSLKNISLAVAIAFICSVSV